jgi:hypothetical protein
MSKKYVVQSKKGIDVREYRCKPRNALASVISEADLADGVVLKTEDGRYVVVSQNVATIYDKYDDLPGDVKQQKLEAEI